MPKILIAESLELETLKNIISQKNSKIYFSEETNVNDNEFNFYYLPDISSTDIENIIEGYDVLCVRPKGVTSLAINNGKNLKLIVRGGAGLNSIDLEAAKKNNVQVKNTPGENSISTAEFAFSLILNLATKRHIQQAASDVRSKSFKEPQYYEGNELAGQKIAIIGLGHIGSAVAKRCQAFDMDVIVYTRTKKNLPYKQFNTLEELLESQPDIITFHVPLLPQTDKYFSYEYFNMLKKGTIMVNVARPQIIDSVAFKEALDNGVISSFGIDGDYELIKPFLDADKSDKGIITHHIADSTKQAQQKITKKVLEHIFTFFG